MAVVRHTSHFNYSQYEVEDYSREWYSLSNELSSTISNSIFNGYITIL